MHTGKVFMVNNKMFPTTFGMHLIVIGTCAKNLAVQEEKKNIYKL